jgi:hypothetical protein
VAGVRVSLGAPVALATADALDTQELEGEVFAFDSNARCLVIKQGGSTPQQGSFRILTLDGIRSSTVQTARPAGAVPPLPQVDLQRCLDREEKALRAAISESAKLGVGVTREAQQIFNALAKTLPCRWDGKVIAVLEEVRGAAARCRVERPPPKAVLPRQLDRARRYSSTSLTAPRTAEQHTPMMWPRCAA